MASTQVVVVGGGPGGYDAAFLAADLGLSVSLVDPESSPGGVCVYRGCIPSKALLHVAKLIGGTSQLVRHRKVQYFQGLAEIVDAHHLRIKLKSGGEEPLEFEHAILA